MRKLIVCAGVVLFMMVVGSFSSQGQIMNGAYKRSDILQKKPMALSTVREADVYWSKKVLRIIDLREKMNLPLFYPTMEMEGRVNLITVLLNGIESGQITPYDASEDDDFKMPMTYAQVKESFGAETTSVEKIDFDTGERVVEEVAGEVRVNAVKQYMLKEEWYFDKQTSTLNVRIIGICPIREFVREGDSSGQIQREQLFWVYYPEVRPLLATNLVLNPYNEARQMSFDDVFIKRYFNSYIIMESNVYDDRVINTYMTGKQAMLEAQRIEEEIFNFEQDLWEY